MCLAEALLRIPDRATRDALIRDKIAPGDWSAHLGHSRSIFVNAATWGLLVTGRLTATHPETGLSHALTRLIGRGGEPLIRAGVDIAMRMMGEQFVAGQTIAEALANARALEAEGFRHSYDMLGEAATTADDAARYFASYETAIHAIGKASAGRGIYEGPGISIKLSALHPRYSRAKIERVMGELLPRVKALAALAKSYDIGLNIDAEEADRLELSLDLLEALCRDPDLARWNGVGFVIQAYQKRCAFVVDWLVDLARRTQRRLMVRLVKGAYWDSEIKRAQVDGLEGFPVFTRKVHTDVSYLACARKLLDAPDAVFPQFATHNAQTLASIVSMAGPNFYRGQYEFQCLHGMGEPLYSEVVGADKLGRPCRIYAPVGDHETLLAYLVRRLLENGANTSFVNRIADKAVPIDELVADPVETAEAIAPVGAPHAKIAAPRAIFGAARENSAGLDLSNEQHALRLARRAEDKRRDALARGADGRRRAGARGRRAQPRGSSRCRRRGFRRRSPMTSSVCWRPRRTAPRAGRRRRSRTALRRCCAPPTRWSGACRCCWGSIAREAGKVAAQRDFGGARGRRFPALLRGSGQEPAWRRGASPARAGGVHLAVEFSAGDFSRAGLRRARRGKFGAGEARGGNAADRRRSGAPAARGGRADGRAVACAGRGRRRRGAGGRCARAGRDVHGLDAGGAPDPAPARRAAVAERAADPADRRDRRAERDDRGFLRARRAGRRRRDRLGVRFGGAALFGAAHSLPAGGDRRPHAERCSRGRWANSASAIPRVLPPTSGR